VDARESTDRDERDPAVPQEWSDRSRGTIPVMPTTSPGYEQERFRRRGGRSERIRTDVAQAVLDLFREGKSEFSVAEVADRSGVHRSTIYRRWPTAADLLREALSVHTQRIEVPDTGTWAGDVHELAGQLAAFLTDPVEVGMNAALAAGSHPDTDGVVIEHWTPLFRQMGDIVERAKVSGQIDDRTEASLVLHLLVGPLLMKTAFLHETPSDEFVAQLADSVVRTGYRQRAVPPSTV